MIQRLRHLSRSLYETWKSGLRDRFFLSAAAFFILSVLFFALGMAFPSVYEKFWGILSASMENAGVLTEDGGLNSMALLANNISACGFIMLYGFLPLLRFPAFPLGINAMSIGITAAAYAKDGLSMALFFAGLLPHGILELPAMFLAFGTGLFICDNMTRRLRKDPTALGAWGCTVVMARVHLLVLLPLLVAAAMVEAYVTPLVMSLLI